MDTPEKAHQQVVYHLKMDHQHQEKGPTYEAHRQKRDDRQSWIRGHSGDDRKKQTHAGRARGKNDTEEEFFECQAKDYPREVFDAAKIMMG